MHGANKKEVVKCWRLHLGASNLTSMVINSVADEQTLASRCEVLLLFPWVIFASELHI